MISPHCSNTSTMICSVPFSGRPPTNTVLHPGGLSRVAGGGRSKFEGKKSEMKILSWDRLLWNLTFFRDSLIVPSKTIASVLVSAPQKIYCTILKNILSDDFCHYGCYRMKTLSVCPI